MTTLFHIAEQALNRPLLIHPDKVPLILAALEGRIPVDASGLSGIADADIAAMPDGAQRTMRGGGQSPGRRESELYQRAGSTAIVSVMGTLINRGAWIGAQSGLTSYEGVRMQLQAALDDRRVTSIVLDMDSPGGMVAGAFELADLVRQVNAVKPIVTVVDSMAASAAYLIASATSKIVVGQTSITGSIGVVMVHADYSRQLDAKGVTPTLIFSGKHKVDGNSLEPLPKAVRDTLQGELDVIAAMLHRAVGKCRGSKLTAAAARATEAKVYLGADAIKAGLADEIGTMDSVLASLSKVAPKATAPTGILATTTTVLPPEFYQRLSAIMALPQAKGREATARFLATSPSALSLSVEQVAALLPTVPLPSRSERNGGRDPVLGLMIEGAAPAASGVMFPPDKGPKSPMATSVERVNRANGFG